MFGFLIGVAIGAVGAMWYQQQGGNVRGTIDPANLEGRFGELQDRANAVLTEARRILQETRQEMQSAMDAGRQSVTDKAERIRQAAESGEGGTTQQ